MSTPLEVSHVTPGPRRGRLRTATADSRAAMTIYMTPEEKVRYRRLLLDIEDTTGLNIPLSDLARLGLMVLVPRCKALIRCNGPVDLDIAHTILLGLPADDPT